MTCEAHKTIPMGGKLQCDRDRGHVGFHLDRMQGIWWAGWDSRAVSDKGLTYIWASADVTEGSPDASPAR